MLAITALQLANVEDWKDLYQAKLCKASGDPTNTSVCTYIYAVGAVSIVLTIIIGLLQVRGAWAVGGSVAAAPTKLLPASACMRRTHCVLPAPPQQTNPCCSSAVCKGRGGLCLWRGTPAAGNALGTLSSLCGSA